MDTKSIGIPTPLPSPPEKCNFKPKQDITKIKMTQIEHLTQRGIEVKEKNITKGIQF